jgi:ATP-dependent Clp protease ATP-binding subunit ClpC
VFERFTEPARRVVVLAQDEARGFRHHYVGTEHILLGLLRYDAGIPASVLGSFGVTLDEVRVQVVRVVGRRRGESDTPGQIPFTPRAKKVLELSMLEADDMGHGHIGTEHLLLGLLREGEGVAVRILAGFASPADIRAEIVRAFSGGGSDATGRGVPRVAESAKREPLVRHPRRRIFVLLLVVGWLLFATALGVGVLIGWAIWG